MQSASVSALLIVRDEERFLRSCLSSLSRSVDEIVVVDTGSTDNTVAIARDFGARVLFFDWITDFAAARNFAVDSCSTDWALYIDADEQLSERSQVRIADLVDPTWLAADILLRPKVNYTRYRLARLFRIDPRIRFTGAIHETILPSILNIADSSAIGLTSIEIDHFGYEGDLSAKHLRNLPILERCIAEFPDRVFYRFHLTETLLGLNRFQDACSSGKTGVDIAKRLQSEKAKVDAAMICQMLSVAMLDRAADPNSLLDDGLALHPGNHGLLLTKARRELQFGDPHVSLMIARSLQAVDPDRLVPELIAYDRNIFRRYATEMEIASLSKLNRWAEATQLIARNADRLAE